MNNKSPAKNGAFFCQEKHYLYEMDLITTAIQYYGLAEVPGQGSNPIILDWIQKLFPDHDDDSTLSWCSVFIHAMAREAGYKNPVGSDAGLARSWLKHGITVDIKDAKPGDIVVMWRTSLTSWQGHVTLYVNHRTPTTFRGLGGNQENAVNIRTYPESRVLGVRRLLMPESGNWIV